jgi:hypothetical protein
MRVCNFFITAFLKTRQGFLTLIDILGIEVILYFIQPLFAVMCSDSSHNAGKGGVTRPC